MKTPFKFLDAYQYNDRDSFFGRDKEINRLYNLVFQSSLVVVYGLSGTGKSSLVQCGLANKFDGPEWLPLLIRRQSKDLKESLSEMLDNALGTAKTAQQTISEKVQALYVKYFRRVYLIFDQLEELYIDGSEEEQEQFYAVIRQIMDDQLQCTVMLIIREEYLGYLYPMEKVLPTLFDFRLRVEPMTDSSVREVLRKSFEKFNVTLEPPAENRLSEIIDNVSRSRDTAEHGPQKSLVELPYLQVYLDGLYRRDFKDAYPDATEIPQPWPALELTEEEIANFGKIDDVLEDFLLEQQTDLKKVIFERYPMFPEDMVRSLILTFVSDRGTKRPLRVRREHGILVLDDFIRRKVKRLIEMTDEQSVAQALTLCVDRLEAARLIRDSGQTLELAHDSLAAIIDRQRTGEERRMAELRRMVQVGKETWQASGEYLSPGQLSRLEDVLPQMELEPDEIEFIEASRKEAEHKRTAERLDAERRAAEAEAQAEKERVARRAADEAREKALELQRLANRQRHKMSRYLMAAGIFAGICVILLGVAYKLNHTAKNNLRKAEISEEQIKEATAKERLNEAVNIQETADSLTAYPEVRLSLLQEAYKTTFIDTLAATDTNRYQRKLIFKQKELDSMVRILDSVMHLRKRPFK
jgi:endonuclease III-like uncharacterized protein